MERMKKLHENESDRGVLPPLPLWTHVQQSRHEVVSVNRLLRFTLSFRNFCSSS